MAQALGARLDEGFLPRRMRLTIPRLAIPPLAFIAAALANPRPMPSWLNKRQGYG